MMCKYGLSSSLEGHSCPMTAAVGRGARGSRVVGRQMDGCRVEGGRELGNSFFSVSVRLSIKANRIRTM